MRVVSQSLSSEQVMIENSEMCKKAPSPGRRG